MGVNHLIRYYDRTIKLPKKKINFISHPAASEPKYYKQKPIGMNTRQDENDFFFKKIHTTYPLKLSEHVVFLGQIPRINSFEAREPVGQTHDIDGKLTDDYVLDDSALAIKTKQGLVIVTGCSHAGICNIIEHAKLVTGENNILSIIGGFHLINTDEKILLETSKYLNSHSMDVLYPCHCTDLAAKIYLSSHVKIKEVGVGLTLNFSL